MDNSRHSRKNLARTERLQQRAEAGVVSARFPEVAKIVISMMYRQRGIAKSVPRIVNFFPDSCAFFTVDCLNKDCTDGGFDMAGPIAAMVRERRQKVKGELKCEGEGPSADHSDIVYEIAIQYT